MNRYWLIGLVVLTSCGEDVGGPETPFGGRCATDNQCADGQCVESVYTIVSSGAMRCTATCSQDADCAAFGTAVCDPDGYCNEPCTRDINNFFECVDGHRRPCGPDSESCSVCACPRGARCDEATDRCEAPREGGEGCEYDQQCRYGRCLESGVCHAAPGTTPCDPTTCLRCVGIGADSVCLQNCTDNGLGTPVCYGADADVWSCRNERNFNGVYIQTHCVRQCDAEQQCPAGPESCSGAYCIAGCQTDADCPEGESCGDLGECLGSSLLWPPRGP